MVAQNLHTNYKQLPYTAYSDSCIDWLEKIPKHWEVSKFKRISSMNYGDSLPNELRISEDIPVYGSNGIIGYHNQSNTLGATIIIGRKGSFGKVNYSTNNSFVIDTAYFIDKTITTCDLKWLFYLLQLLKLDINSQDSAIPGLSREYVFNKKICYPPLPEQQAIASFLDRETTRLDALIEKKKRLVELLQEKRAALITRAVTKGLNPDTPMKDSGVDWLGEIPAGWVVTQVKKIFKNLDYKRIPISGEQRFNIEKKFPYYGASGIIDFVDNYLFDEPLLLIAEDGANLLSRSTSLAFIAKDKYWVNNHAHILKPNYGDLQYWEYVMQTFDYTPLITGSAQPKLTSDNLKNVYLPRPTFQEQCAIASYLNREKNKIDNLIEKIQTSIEKLKEYRTALISAAVTGKIDVRGMIE